MIRLDTHVAVWLYSGDKERLSPTVANARLLTKDELIHANTPLATW